MTYLQECKTVVLPVSSKLFKLSFKSKLYLCLLSNSSNSFGFSTIISSQFNA